jgi:uncharacterized oxidoreductase
MNTNNKKILITGGGSGIGLSIARAFSGNGNELILVGRNESRLKASAEKLERASYIVCDVADENDVNALVKKVSEHYRGIDILVNNAGVANPQPLDDLNGIFEKAKYEMTINYLSVVRLTEKLMPFLKASKEAAIVNVQSIVSYLPNMNLATYSATKAALHSFSQSLRLNLQRSAPHVKVFEVFPPFVDTDLTKNYQVDKLSPDEVANDILHAMRHEAFAVRNGRTKEVYESFHQSPEETLKQFNRVE